MFTFTNTFLHSKVVSVNINAHEQTMNNCIIIIN